MSLCLLGEVKNNPLVFFVTDDFQGGLSQGHAITDSVIHPALNTKNCPLFLCFFFLLLQCGLRCCPGQKCGHQEAEQTLPEPDPCQEGIPGTGAHEMCQSQKCK